MANICSCCGKKLPFLDVFDSIQIDGEDYYVCSACNGNFSEYKSGKLSFEKLTSNCTEPKLKAYFEKFSPGERTVEDIRQKEQKIEKKLIERENNPLYDDIHQIAGDLRFIKNLIIFGIACGVIFGIIGVLGVL